MKTKVVSLVIFVLLLVNNTIYQVNAGNSNLVNNSKFKVYCPEFPDANLNQSYIDLTNITIKMVDGNIKLINGDKATIDEFNNAVKDIKFKNSIKQQLTEGKKLIGIISVNIVVAERYKTISNKIICNESRLLSSDEVAEIKATNSDTINSLSLSYVGSDNDVKYELYLNFAVYQVTPTNYAAEYELYGIASWDSIGFDVMEHPAIGEDFLGFAWGGGFSQKAQEAYGYYNGTRTDFGITELEANAGCIWGFEELMTAGPSGQYPYTYDNITSVIRIYKNSLTGYGNETSLICKYVHTYDEAMLNFSISASPSISYSSSTNKNWSLVTVVNGIPY